MKKQLLQQDIQLLRQLFFRNAWSDEPGAPFQRNEKPLNILVLNGSAFPENVSDYDGVIALGNERITGFKHTRTFYYVKNPDRSIRWLYTRGNLRTVLGFYAEINSRSKLIARFIRFAAGLSADWLVRAGKITIASNEPLKTDTLVAALDAQSYSIFTGTQGAERTPLLAVLTGKRITHYIKIGLNRLTMNRIETEKRSIRRLSFMELHYTAHPQEIFLNLPDVVVTTNIKPPGARRSTEFHTIHFKALCELFEQTRLYQTVQDSLFWTHILNNINELRQHPRQAATKRITELLGTLKFEIYYDCEVFTHTSFGDFTPWNHYFTDDKLYVYDLECAQFQAPFMYDLFHFHFQNGIISGQDFKTIYNNCLQVCEHPVIRKLIDLYEIDIDWYLKLYLMYITSEQVLLMQFQTSLSPNHLLQLKVWEEGLRYVIDGQEQKSHRELFLTELMPILEQSPHAFVKFNDLSVYLTPMSSDLDIAITPEGARQVLSLAKNYSYTLKTLVTNRSFMTTVTCFFRDQTYLTIDLVSQFKRRHIEFMSLKNMLDSAKTNAYGFRVPELQYDLEYCLCFYYLNHAAIPEKYRLFFARYPENEKAEAVNYLRTKYAIPYTRFEDLFEHRKLITYCISSKLRSEQLRKPFKWLRNSLFYIFDTLRNAFHNRSLTITLSGVDGVGKTTVIREVTQLIKAHLRREVVLLRHRPGILPILSSIKHGSREKAEQVASVTKPGTGDNHNKWSSMLRFGYYFTDYLIGQVIVFFKYKLRGKIVVYDRYYFDFINHPERSNIRIPKRFSKWFYRFISKPNLNILLIAKSEDILQRKQELDKETIERLISEYTDLFEEFRTRYPQSHYCTIENNSIEETTSRIIDIIQKVA